MEKWDILFSFEDIFTKIGGHVLNDLSHILAEMKFILVCLCVCQLVHLFIEKFNSWIFCSVFKISLRKSVDIFS